MSACAPVAPPNKNLQVTKNTAVTYASAKLLAGATDADPGDTLSVTAALVDPQAFNW